MPVPFTFGTATSAIPLSQLDSNFATAITIGNTAVQLGNTVTTLNNMTLANVTISSGNVTITNVSVTTANVSGTANVQTLAVTQNATVAGNATVTGNVSMNVATITTANVSGTANVQTLAVTQNATIAGNATVTGNVSMNVGTITTANVSGTANVSSLVVLTNETVLGNTSVTGNVTASAFTSTSSFGFKNRIINGAMVIDQRNAGASVTPTNTQYSVDRWQSFVSAASKFTIQQNAGAITPPAGFTNYLGATSSSAYSLAAGDYFTIQQRIEGYNVSDLNFGKASATTITVSFWVRSSLTGTFGGAISNGAQNRGYPFTYTISSANTWEQKSVTIAGDTTGTWETTSNNGMFVIFSLGTGTTYSGTAGAWAGSALLSATGATSVVGTNGATFYITGVQLEKGSTATSFDYRPYGTELALCQRYFQNLNKDYMPYNVPLFNGGSNTIWAFTFPVIMRSAPTLTYTGSTGISYFNSAGGAQQNGTLTSISGGYNSSLGGARVYHTLLGQSGLTGWLEIATGTGSFAFSSEL